MSAGRYGSKSLCAVCAKSLQSCLTLCDPMDCNPPGSSVRGIFQARVLEWGAIAFSVKKVNTFHLLRVLVLQRAHTYCSVYSLRQK